MSGAQNTERAAGLRRFKPYPACRDPGVAWLGKIPAQWEVKALKRLAAMRAGTAITSNEIEPAGQYPVFGGNGVRGYTSSFTHEGEFPLIGRQGALCGCVNFASGRFWASEHAVVATPGLDVDPHWLTQLLQAMSLNAYSQSAAQPGLAVDTIGAIQAPAPSIEEQRAIAAFLDRETARIDALVAKKERLIELLEEKRTALITRAVTKGLDPNVPMKNSGVKWLGEIPAHWKVKRLKRIGDLQAGAGFPIDEQGVTTEDIPFFKVGDMGSPGNEREMVEWQHTVSAATARRLRAFVIPAGTIVFAKVGAALLLNRRRLLTRPSCIDNNMMGFMPGDCDGTWALYWLSDLDMGELANPGAVPSVNEGQMRETPAAVPAVPEQRAIAAFLDRETARIDVLIAKVREAVDRLKELRTAVISAAVTGKIDVREETA